jgi:hypothetical protein
MDKIYKETKVMMCIKTGEPTMNGVLCRKCKKPCEHSGRIKMLDAMLREELRPNVEVV